MMKWLFALLAVSAVSSSASADPKPPRLPDKMVYEPREPLVSAHVNTNVIFMNRCVGGCLVQCSHQTDSTTNGSSICGGGPKTLSAFGAGDAVWGQVMSCVRQVFAPFNVVITDVDPGTAPHFEIMTAGKDSDLGLSGLGGVSPFSCDAYIPNSLVFAFANYYGNNVEEICSVAAQEIAHSFALDHVIEPSDPLTYFDYPNGRRLFQDRAVQCGSDCVNGKGPFGQTCSGPMTQSHKCACSGQQTQNSVATIKALFGTGTLKPPEISISRPKNGDHVDPGFPINTTATDDIGIMKVDLKIDGVMVGSASADPYAFNAPADLADGTHRIEVTATDVTGATATAVATIAIGAPCTKPGDCPLDTDTCVGGRCVPGSGVQGGLGTECAHDVECASGICITGETHGKLCSDTCDITDSSTCPSGYDCLEYGSGGVCYPGEPDGGCDTGGATGGLVIFAAAGLVFLGRRRRTSHP